MVPLGTWIWLASELMFFAALFAAYFMIREVTNGAAPEGEMSMFAASATHLNKPFAAINTAILVLSSFACQLGVMKAEHGQVKRSSSLFNVAKWGMREWYILTFLMGAVFIAGQALEYVELVHHGVTIQDSAYGTMFYLTTGFHGMHVFGGLVAFLFVLGRTYLARTFTHEQAVSAMVISYYWHFVDVIWIILFSVIYLLPN